jgi:hypothetical protein
VSRFSNKPFAASNPPAADPPGSRQRPPLDSTVRRVQRGVEPLSREPFVPSRNTSSGTPRANPFASLENETTQAIQVSDELLGLAREESSDGGATKAYQVPPELLELARANKEKRAAARRAQRATAATEGEKPVEVTAAAPAEATPPHEAPPERAPSRPSAAPFELAPRRVMLKAVPELADVPDFRGHGARKRAARFVLAALCLIALCAVGALCGRLVREHYLTMVPAAGASQL